MPDGMIVFDGNLYFRANDGIRGAELWATKRTAAGTTLVADIWSGSNGSSPSRLTEYDDLLYFWAENTVVGSELWVTDGTAGDTTLVIDLW